MKHLEQIVRGLNGEEVVRALSQVDEVIYGALKEYVYKGATSPSIA